MREWTDEQKKARSDYMKAMWAKRSFRRRMKERAMERRAMGKNLVNIPQLESDRDYRDYQRLQHRSWYKKNREKWNAYTLKKKYEQMNTDELLALRNKWINQIENFKKEQYKKYINLIDEVLSDRLEGDIFVYEDPDAWRNELNEEVK
jgi:hypothetical protein